MKRELNITASSGGAAFTVRVVTRASRTEIAGLQDGILKVRLTEAPADGAANKQLVEFMAETFGVGQDQIEIVAGENSRDKLISIDDVVPTNLEEKIRSFVSNDDED